jgi:hypothetical protein
VQPLRLAAVGLAAAAALSFAGPVPARSSPTFTFFRTPSHNVACVASAAYATSLRCDILSGLVPRPPRPARCSLDWGFGYTLFGRGRAEVTCAGDSANDPHAKVIPYGASWRLGPFRCTSRRAGLRCTNRDGHGFFLSRARSRRF